MRRALVVGSGSVAKRHIYNLRILYPCADVICVSSSGRKIIASEVGATKVADALESVVIEKLDIAVVASPATFHLMHAGTLLKKTSPSL